MPNATIEQRVADLEQEVADLSGKIPSPPVEKDWRSTVGMFAGDSVMREVDFQQVPNLQVEDWRH